METTVKGVETCEVKVRIIKNFHKTNHIPWTTCSWPRNRRRGAMKTPFSSFEVLVLFSERVHLCTGARSMTCTIFVVLLTFLFCFVCIFDSISTRSSADPRWRILTPNLVPCTNGARKKRVSRNHFIVQVRIIGPTRPPNETGISSLLAIPATSWNGGPKETKRNNLWTWMLENKSLTWLPAPRRVEWPSFPR